MKNNSNEIDKIELLRELQQNIYNRYSDIDYVPCKFKFRESFPIANFSKKDVRLMKSETDGFIFVENDNLTNVKKLVK